MQLWIVITGLVVVVVVGYGLMRIIRWVFPMVTVHGLGWKEYRLRSRWNKFDPYPYCVEGSQCRITKVYDFVEDGIVRHRDCVNCGGVTCSRGGWIDPDTLKRTVTYICKSCRRDREVLNSQSTLAQQRRTDDLAKVTVPPVDDHVIYGTMPDQYPGLTRDAIRVFLDSDATEAVIEGIGAQTLNESLASTGQQDEPYAETRGKETVLRKT